MTDDNTESISAKLRRLSAKGGNCYCEAAGEYGIDCSDMQCSSCRRLLMTKIADEIDVEKQSILRNCAYPLTHQVGKPLKEDEDFESWLDRYYLPRPLFEDGEPVQFGDEIEHPDSGKTCSVNSIHVFENGYFAMSLHGYDASASYEAGKCVKRPKQPVLDAGGAPIEVGDTVWVDEPEHVNCPWDVVFIQNDGYVIVHQCFGGEREIAVSPSKITHREPDTQERIDDDATMPPRAYYAKHIGHDVGLKDDEEVWTAVTAHLLRRQRELDGRDAS